MTDEQRAIEQACMTLMQDHPTLRTAGPDPELRRKAAEIVANALRGKLIAEMTGGPDNAA